MAYLGDIRLGNTIGGKFTTRQISGAPFTLAGSPILSAYAAGSNSPITAGFALTVDYPKTGLNDWTLVASSGNGFATATNYQVVITTGTVNSVSVVGEVIAEFSIENRSALMPTTAARTLVVDAAGLGDANTVKVGPTGSGTAQTAGDIPARLPAALTGAGNLKVDALAINGVATTPVTTIKAVQGLAVDGVINTLTNLPAITNNWLTAAGIAANALNGKGDWLLSSGYTAPDNAGISSAASSAASAASSAASAAISAASADSKATTIQAQTDKLVFTAPGYVDVNVLKIHGVTIVGDGSATPFNV